ncbi:GIY-YIG nuclease family protein [Mesorhizobium sp. M1322]|uniref:GIY-YIG nuclease family protein n=1 Tax=Mesorhizobium sp. M1322 TaxID=2957081 RepID=UPI0033363014
MQLTSQQHSEILRHRIPLSMVFDASDLSRQQAIRAMSENNEMVMVNGIPCRKDRTHVLRTRHGHCVECNPAGLAFQDRHSQEGHTYLAGSERTGLFKIGMAVDPHRRERAINLQHYGGASDWKLLALVRSQRSGLIEYEAQRILAVYRVSGSYEKDGRKQSCYELFRCSHEAALTALKKSAALHGREVTMEVPPAGRYGIREEHPITFEPQVSMQGVVGSEGQGSGLLKRTATPTVESNASSSRTAATSRSWMLYAGLIVAAFIGTAQFTSVFDAAVVTACFGGPLILALWAFLTDFNKPGKN